jgi:hypothetical protein
MFICNSRPVVGSSSFTCVSDNDRSRTSVSKKLEQVVSNDLTMFLRWRQHPKETNARRSLFLSFSLSRQTEREAERQRTSLSICSHTHTYRRSRIVLDAMQPFIEQPHIVLEPKSTYLLENQTARLECRAIRTRQIFFNCDTRWLPENEHRKSTTLDVSDRSSMPTSSKRECFFRLRTRAMCCWWRRLSWRAIKMN